MGFAVLGPLTPMTPRASIAFLFVTPQLWRECVQRRFFAGLPFTFAGFLPTVSHLFRSCLRLVLASWLITFGRLSFNQVPNSYRGLTPHKFTPMSGVPMHVSRRIEFIEVVNRSRRPRDRYRCPT